MTTGASSDAPQLKHLLQQCSWAIVDIILGDRGYDSRECFNEIVKHVAVPGIPVRKNATTKSKGSLSKRKAVLQQQKDFEQW